MSSALIGKLVNGYEILSQVGQGGMATVFLARQQSMNRNVALKFLPSAYLNDESYLQRFEREVRIVTRLEHRNIVPVYDFGEYEGQPYIAMRYMPSGSVEELLAAGKIALPRVLSIVEQVASALDYAHQNGILHRDLKPSNILLDDGGGVFITDFGIARILSESGSNITTQGVVGTPSYMSPEQAQGEPLDGRSDVYALGVMLFELITGRRPFESDTPYSIAVLHVTAPPPSPRDFEPSLSLRVEQVIMRALQKAPQDRYANAGELAEALRLAIEAETGSAGLDATASGPDQQVPGRGTGPSAPTTNNLPISAESPPRVARAPSVPRQLLSPKRGRMWLGMAAGGALGCGLLLVLLGVAASLLGILPSDSAAASTATQNSMTVVEPSAALTASDQPAPTATATLVRATDLIQSTLASLNAFADATFTAEALRPTARPADIQPVGVRERPVLNQALQDADGELVYFGAAENDGETEPVFEIVTLNLGTWETRGFGAPGGSSSYPQASPDGRWIAFQSNRDGDFDIYVANRLGGQIRQLTQNDVWDRLPAWSPDGSWIVYSSDVRGDETFDLYRVRPDGAAPQPLYSDGWRNSHARYSPDGRSMVFTAGQNMRDARSWELRLLDLASGESRLLTQNDGRDASPVFSPNGQRITYVATTGGARSLVSMNVNGADRIVLYSGPGSVWAASYSPDGRYIIVTATLNGVDQLFLMEADGGNVQQITTTGGAYASWIPPIR
ncbi:MAG: protein kinase [Chloroflexi bacterium]|nr:protein kinase [Chloroflexota bacterium]